MLPPLAPRDTSIFLPRPDYTIAMYAALCLILLLVLLLLVTRRPMRRAPTLVRPNVTMVYAPPPPSRDIKQFLPMMVDYVEGAPKARNSNPQTRIPSLRYGLTKDDAAWYQSIYDGGIRTNLAGGPSIRYI